MMNFQLSGCWNVQAVYSMWKQPANLHSLITLPILLIFHSLLQSLIFHDSVDTETTVASGATCLLHSTCCLLGSYYKRGVFQLPSRNAPRKEKRPILILSLIFFRWPIQILRLGLVTQDSKTCKVVFSLP